MRRDRRGRASRRRTPRRYAVCIATSGFEVSLETRKIYEVLPEKKNAGGELILVIDDSGEDYLYPRDMFVPIELPAAVAAALAQASSNRPNRRR